MKAPIWERQGRRKPYAACIAAVRDGRYGVWSLFPGRWRVEVPNGYHHIFPTHAEAIAWADREARRAAR